MDESGSTAMAGLVHRRNADGGVIVQYVADGRQHINPGRDFAA
jgi:hypothetical protein